MPVRDGREYRSFQLEDVSAEDSYIVEGYATTFDIPYEMGRGLYEVIHSEALDGADVSDVIFQLNHQGPVMARIRNRTLALERDAHGLHMRADLSGSQAGRDLHEAIKNGLIDRMSWGFSVAPGGWEYDEDTRTSHVVKVEKVFDVSAVSIPANEGTDIHARSYLDGVIDGGGQELPECESEVELRGRIAASLLAI